MDDLQTVGLVCWDGSSGLRYAGGYIARVATLSLLEDVQEG